MNAARNVTVSTVPCHKKTSFKRVPRIIRNEYDVWTSMEENVLYNLAQLTFHKGKFDRGKFVPCFGMPSVIGEPDHFFYHDGILIFPIELKSSLVLRIPTNTTLITKYTQQMKLNGQDYYAEGYVLHSIHQIFGYMSHNSCKYGILSTYDQTWFLERDYDVLYISPAIAHNNKNPTLYQCYAYIILCACQDPYDQPYNPDNTSEYGGNDGNDEYDSKRENQDQTKKKTIKKKEKGKGNCGSQHGKRREQLPIGVSETVEVEEVDLNKCHLGDILGVGRSGMVFRGELYGEEVAVKVCDLSQNPTYQEEMLNEVSVYSFLKNLQGICIPKLKFAGYDGFLFVIATEIVGSPLEVGELSDQERQEIVDKLSSIHMFGIVHNDIVPGNILVHRSNEGFRVSFIDFTFSSRATPEKLMEEMSKLKKLLNFEITKTTKNPKQN